MVGEIEVSHLLEEMYIRNTDIPPNCNDIRSTAYMHKLYAISFGMLRIKKGQLQKYE